MTMLLTSHSQGESGKATKLGKFIFRVYWLFWCPISWGPSVHALLPDSPDHPHSSVHAHTLSCYRVSSIPCLSAQTTAISINSSPCRLHLNPWPQPEGVTSRSLNLPPAFCSMLYKLSRGLSILFLSSQPNRSYPSWAQLKLCLLL